ncbi:hypothetical protein P154DRAFT_568816 [Amniculicola lignicola CBS 123094]|uniref:Uncharacterized protein n=1 Tax=Amniculicola lignicola CBS 123094 TaxID=1392246 RepID=A0A6A5X4Y4_9PLEO|nr:hypothetical protein P154DRAFT_568816 [Amniculicola lignicola CBS 123094]
MVEAPWTLDGHGKLQVEARSRRASIGPQSWRLEEAADERVPSSPSRGGCWAAGLLRGRAMAGGQRDSFSSTPVSTAMRGFPVAAVDKQCGSAGRADAGSGGTGPGGGGSRRSGMGTGREGQACGSGVYQPAPKARTRAPRCNRKRPKHCSLRRRQTAEAKAHAADGAPMGQRGSGQSNRAFASSREVDVTQRSGPWRCPKGRQTRNIKTPHLRCRRLAVWHSDVNRLPAQQQPGHHRQLPARAELLQPAVRSILGHFGAFWGVGVRQRRGGESRIANPGRSEAAVPGANTPSM